MSTAAAADSAIPAPRSSQKRRSLYPGDPGMWSWVLHRITGATIFFFLLVHVLDTALVRVSPEAYNEVINTYKTPIIGFMEMGLVAAASGGTLFLDEVPRLFHAVGIGLIFLGIYLTTSYKPATGS